MDIVEVNNRLLTILAKLFGYAAKPMASALEKKGGTLTGSPARFISQRNEGSGTITIGPLPRECRKRMERDPAPGAAAEAKPLGSASCPGVTLPFIVGDREGPLKEGELERAVQWAKQILES
jgi:hypothetical protein